MFHGLLLKSIRVLFNLIISFLHSLILWLFPYFFVFLYPTLRYLLSFSLFSNQSHFPLISYTQSLYSHVFFFELQIFILLLLFFPFLHPLSFLFFSLHCSILFYFYLRLSYFSSYFFRLRFLSFCFILFFLLPVPPPLIILPGTFCILHFDQYYLFPSFIGLYSLFLRLLLP
jgi:hypothetical protein